MSGILKSVYVEEERRREDDVARRKEARVFLFVHEKGRKNGRKRRGGGIDWNKFAARQKEGKDGWWREVDR